MSFQTKSKRDQKKLIFLFLIPLLILLVGFTVFKDLFIKPDKPETKNQKLASDVPDLKKDFVDSLSKTDLYSNMESQQQKVAAGKAVFDEVGNIGTDMKSTNQPGNGNGQENLQARIKNEVATPMYGDPVVPKFTKHSSSIDEGTENYMYKESKSTESTDNGFNSIVLPDGNKKDENTNSYGYYGDKGEALQSNDISVLAETVGQQKISSEGGHLKMVLKEELKLNGQVLPAGTTITGQTRFNQNRVDVDVRSININNKIVYCSLKGFDMDGVEGLALKEKDLAKMGKNAYNEELDQLDMGIESKLPGYAGQVAGTIIRSFSRNKKGKSEIAIPANYKIILRN
jgi:hypothetical protein